MRSMSTTGAKGIPPPSSSTQPPTRARAPAARARVISSPTSRDLPTPASPPTSTVTASPFRARASAASSAVDSASRPTRTGLTRLPPSHRILGLQSQKKPGAGPRRAGFEINAPFPALSISRCGTCARCGSWSRLFLMLLPAVRPAFGDEQMVRVSPQLAHQADP